MFATIFAFALIAASYVTAEIPSYIHVCSRKDPNLDQCILNNVENLKSKICEGIPELDIEPNDPFMLDKLIISDTPSSKISIRDSQLTGLCNFDVKHFHVDIDKLHFDVNLLYKRLQMNATYDFDLRLLVPIVHKGLVYITTDNVEAQVAMDMKLVSKSGERYVYMSNMKLNLDIKGYDAKYGLDSIELSRLNEVISNFIGNNQQEIINAFKPAIEKVVIERVLSLSNKIVTHFTFEELFPERI